MATASLRSVSVCEEDIDKALNDQWIYSKTVPCTLSHDRNLELMILFRQYSPKRVDELCAMPCRIRLPSWLSSSSMSSCFISCACDWSVSSSSSWSLLLSAEAFKSAAAYHTREITHVEMESILASATLVSARSRELDKGGGKILTPSPFPHPKPRWISAWRSSPQTMVKPHSPEKKSELISLSAWLKSRNVRNPSGRVSTKWIPP